ncbi:MAG: hypothetical protein KF764_12580 [Labilithrix sp.]|nr:hypothetical protein [Labilithrix sp.]MBX3223757.1 hypothetical protein [Labilithrix sp.]
MRRSLATCTIALALGAPAVARAEDVSAADKLFEEANALASAGRYAEACPKLAESQRIEPAVGTQFNLADCEEHVGRTATAFALFNEVARIARAAGKFERERVAKERAASLAPRLANVRLVVHAPAPGLEVMLDGALVPREKWETPFPIDPGRHRVTASAPARTTWESTTEAVPAETVEVTVPELVDPTPRPRVEERAPSSSQRTIAIAVAGAAVAGIAVGAIAGAMSLSARSRAEESCPAATYAFRCPTVDGTDQWNSATTAGNVSTVGFVIGGVALAGAAVLWFTAPSRAAAGGRAAGPSVRAGASATGLRLEGTF